MQIGISSLNLSLARLLTGPQEMQAAKPEASPTFMRNASFVTCRYISTSSSDAIAVAQLCSAHAAHPVRPPPPCPIVLDLSGFAPPKQTLHRPGPSLPVCRQQSCTGPVYVRCRPADLSGIRGPWLQSRAYFAFLAVIVVLVRAVGCGISGESRHSRLGAAMRQGWLDRITWW